MDSKVNDWVKISEYDLETAQVMLRAKRYLYVPFMCHQAIERLLKAFYLLETNTIPPRTDNLILLAQETGLFSSFPEEQISFLLVLESLSGEIRHPDFTNGMSVFIDLEKSREMIKSTRGFHAWINERLREKSDKA